MLVGGVSNNLRVAGCEFRGAGWWFLRRINSPLKSLLQRVTRNTQHATTILILTVMVDNRKND